MKFPSGNIWRSDMIFVEFFTLQDLISSHLEVSGLSSYGCLFAHLQGIHGQGKHLYLYLLRYLYLLLINTFVEFYPYLYTK